MTRINRSNHGFLVTNMIIRFLNGLEEDTQNKDDDA